VRITVHTQRRDRRCGYGVVHQPADSGAKLLGQLASGDRRRILGRIRALDQLAALVRERPYVGRWAA